jgi:uncharacterized membrane protein YsdA (DUF1294 family)
MQLSILFILLNIVGYYLMYNDKQRAKKKQWRIREAHLLGIAAIGGGIGVWLGTKAPIFHKSAHWQFRIGVPMMMLAQIVLVYFFLK